MTPTRFIFSKNGLKTIAVLLVLCVATIPVVAQENSDEGSVEPGDDYDSGLAAGKQDARGKGIWILSGLFLGPIGLILPWVISPKVPGGNLIGKSAKYIDGYTEGYKNKARARNFMYSLLGFPIWVWVAVDACEGLGAGCIEVSSCLSGDLPGCSIPSLEIP